MRRRPRIAAPAALAAWLLLGGSGFASEQIFEQVLVNVNGDILTRRQLDERVRSVLAQREGRAITAADMRGDPALLEQAAALAPRVATEAIDELLVLQQARELGFDVDDDDVDRVLARMRLDNNIATDAEFAELLRTQAIQPDALRASIRNQILIEQVRQSVFRRAPILDSEAEAYYRANPAEFAPAPAVVFRELFVAMPSLEATRASADAAVAYDRALIRFVKARDRLLAGEDFAEVARTVSDAPTREAGGAVGPVDPRTLAEPVRAALAKLAVGATSAPIRTELGYSVLKLERVDAARRVTFEEARERIVAQLLERRQVAAFTALVKQLRERALLVWKDRTLKAAYEARAQVQSPRS